ncbi:MAG: glycosyltransferase family 4 protein [Gemmatimonadales bacterium]|nr:glycosyltransferase family 4 protein [Gemmatimonadales bacterium]
MPLPEDLSLFDENRHTGLRFGFLTTFYPPYNFGGDGIGVQRLSRGLVRAGHRVTVVHDVDAYEALAPGPPPPASPEPDGLEVVSLRSGAGVLSPLLTHQAGRPIINARRIRQLLATRSFDVITYHNISLLGGPGLYAYGDAVKLHMAHEHWLVCPTHVLWRHGREVCTGRQCFRCQLHYRRPPQWWRWTGLLERNLHHVDRFIAMSEFSRAKHMEFGFPREMDVLPYFLPDDREAVEDTSPTTPPQSRPYFIFVGRLELIKGLQDVLPLFEGEGAADLVVAGDGEYGATLRAMAGHNPRIRFLGRVGSDELGEWYRGATALLVPSLCFETFGIILLEAFRQSTPVIARRLGPLPELIESSGGGMLFGDRGELAAAMARLLQDPAFRATLARSGRAALDALWSERTVVPRYLDIVRSAAADRGNARVLSLLS